MELSGEYVGPASAPQRLRVSCDPAGDADRLQGLLSGVARMKELVAELFGPLVQRDAPGRTTAAADDPLDGDEDDAEDENNTDNRTNSLGSSTKRLKPS